MPVLTPRDQLVLHISTLKKAEIQVLIAQPNRTPFPLTSVMQMIVSERLSLAGENLRVGDQLLADGHYRWSIGRHYYAMYHAARAVAYYEHKGDDYERHRDLPRHLPSTMPNVAQHEAALTNARLLRNQADYDIYPANASCWDTDARTLSSTAAQFVSSFETYALENGLV